MTTSMAKLREPHAEPGARCRAPVSRRVPLGLPWRIRRRVSRHGLVLALLLGTVVVALHGCGAAGDDPAVRSAGITLVERNGGDWAAPVPARLLEAIGYRDGARTRGRFTVRDTLGRRFRVDLLIEVDPRPTLLEGSWADLREPGRENQTVRAEELHFLGGQGGSPSLGGRLSLLRADGEAAFRLSMPPLPLEPVRPGSMGPIESGSR